MRTDPLASRALPNVSIPPLKKPDDNIAIEVIIHDPHL